MEKDLDFAKYLEFGKNIQQLNKFIIKHTALMQKTKMEKQLFMF